MACILIVDDEPEARYALARVLDSAGHRVLDAPSAGEALRLLASTGVDLVLCDAHLPGDGVADLRRRAPDTAIVAIARSGLAGSAGEVDRARRCGVLDVLHAPFDGETLIAAVAPLLARPALG